MPDAVALCAIQCGGHARLVDIVWARIGDRNDYRRQPDRLVLCAQNLLAHAMHADALEGLGDGRERADDIIVARTPDLMQRPRRVLAARPRDEGLWLVHRRAGRLRPPPPNPPP